MAAELESWLWAHADDWLNGRPGAATLEKLQAVSREAEIPPDFLTYVAPNLVSCADARLRTWALQVLAAALQSEELQKNACRTITSAFDQAEIPHVFVKGADFRYRLYPDPFRRVSSDVDVLVAPETAERSVACLLATGALLDEDPLVFLARGAHTLAVRVGGVAVDLHQTIVQVGRSRFESREIVTRRQRMAVGDGHVWVASPEDATALCLIHIGRHEGGAEYIGFRHGLDLLLICSRLTSLSWSEIAERARSWRCLRLAGAGLWSWEPQLGARIPREALRRLDPGALQRVLARRTHRVLRQRRTRARGMLRLSQLGRKFVFAEGWPERKWLCAEMLRRARSGDS